MPEEVAARRLSALLDLQTEIQREINAALVGRDFPILVEGATSHGQTTGRTPCNRILHLEEGARAAAGAATSRPASPGGFPIRWPEGWRLGGAMIKMEIKGLLMDPVSNMPVVILRDTEKGHFLPIWVGIFEANAIALEMEKVIDAAADDPRPPEEPPRRSSTRASTAS